MEINVTNNLPYDVEVRTVQTFDGSVTIILSEAKSRILGDVKPGSVVKIGNREYIVLGHAEETTAVITKDFTKEMEFGQSGDYLTSDVRKYCNSEFYNELVAVVGTENIVKHTVKLVADDGTGKGKTCRDNVSIITAENYRRYREYLPIPNKSYWVATGITTFDETFAHYVCSVCSDGILRWNDCGYSHGVRPFCILNSSIPLSD